MIVYEYIQDDILQKVEPAIDSTFFILLNNEGEEGGFATVVDLYGLRFN